MEELDAKRLLRENNRLINEHNDLSCLLGEEKEMVRYLHGVIKNYEYLLRTNSQNRKKLYRPKVYRNTPDTEVDKDLISRGKTCENLECNIPKLHSLSLGRKMANASLGCFEKRHHDMLCLQTLKEKVIDKQDIREMEYISVQDDLLLEDLEVFSISSSEEPSGDSCLVLRDVMESKGYDERVSSAKNEKHATTSRIFPLDGISRDLHQNKPTNSNRSNENENGQRTDGRTSDTDTGGNVISCNQSYFEEPLDNTLEELNKELERIANELNLRESALARSEKHLGKMEHRMDYLESFVLGKESGYL